MSLVTFKDLCIDVNDSRPASEFWAGTLGLELTGFDDDPDEFKLVGPTPQHTVWPNVVPEPHEVKNRVHIDVWTDSLDRLLDLGARRVDIGQTGQEAWEVLADPEGNEFCAFVTDKQHDHLLKTVVIDSVESRAMAHWWQGLLGGTIGSDEENDWHWVTEIDGVPFEGLDFGPVPEPKTVKNRVHWDVELNDGVELGDLEAAGATVLRRPDDEIRWTIMADPEGNEFCVFEQRD
jgi:hypothetical protein